MVFLMPTHLNIASTSTFCVGANSRPDTFMVSECEKVYQDGGPVSWDFAYNLMMGLFQWRGQGSGIRGLLRLAGGDCYHLWLEEPGRGRQISRV